MWIIGNQCGQCTHNARAHPKEVTGTVCLSSTGPPHFPPHTSLEVALPQVAFPLTPPPTTLLPPPPTTTTTSTTVSSSPYHTEQRLVGTCPLRHGFVRRQPHARHQAALERRPCGDAS